MVRIKKFIVGIRPMHKMFRIGSLGGSVIDAILTARADKTLGESYFTDVGKAPDQLGYLLSNDELGNVLRIEEANIIFIKDLYENERKLDFEKLFSEWRFLWKILNSILNVRDIRRLGVAAEHQFEARVGTASNQLHSTLLSGMHPQHTGRFSLQFEDRRPERGRTGLPDASKDAFINVIHHYYDSELDEDHKTPRHINANLDVQKYYAPFFNGPAFDEVTEVFRIFQKEKDLLDDELKKKDLV